MEDYDRFIEIQSNQRKNFKKKIKDPIFLDSDLVIDLILKPQSNLEKNDSPIILKKWFFPQEQTHTFSHQ